MTKILIPEAALKKHIAILGMNGSGKTSVAKSQIIEPALAAGERVCNIDPTGVGWGLRLSSSGKSKGYPVYIVGGERADFPLFKRDGNAWAEIVGTSSDSFVFDTSQMTVTDRSLWFTDFAEALIRRNSGPLKLVLDEAHLFAPQGGAKSGGVAPEMLHATNNLLALGRSKGLRITMISQRPAKLHKDSLTQAHTLIAMMLMAPQDRAAVNDWIADQADPRTGKEIIASLPSLAPGEGWVWAPREKVLERVKFPRPHTFDSSSAPDDRDGEAIALAPINPDAIKAKLATVAKETVANDPKSLRAEIAKLRTANATLERQMTDAVTAKIVADPDAMEKARKQGFEQAEKKLVAAMRRELNAKLKEGLAAMRKHAAQAIDHIDDELREINAKDAELGITFDPPSPLPPPAAVKSALASLPRAPVARPVQRHSEGNGHDRPLGAERKPLAALAAVTPAGMTEGQWRVAAGFKNSGTWSTYRGRLLGAGRIEQRGDIWFATEQGVADLGDNVPTMPPPGKELVEFWISRISGVGPILRRLAEVYPEAIERDQLAADVGLVSTSGTYSTYLGRLRTPGLIEVGRDKMVRASPMLMEGTAT
jgi:hypothetical protein